MGFLQTPFFLGNLSLPSNIFYAPLAGCSDLPFRSMSCRYRPGIVYCEMVKIDALVRHDVGTYRLLDYESWMHPIGAQLCGSKLQLIATASKIIEDLGFDVIDLNCGCPVDKVTKDGSGSGMLKHPDHIGDMISEMVHAVKIPVTVKIRTGWDEKTICAPKITEIAEQAGARAITIHGRTREQGYKGFANLDIIGECKKRAKHIHVIGNGDIFDPVSAHRMFSVTNCDAILVSRGTLGKPWIVQQIQQFLSQEEVIEKTVFDIKDHLLIHFEEILRYQNEKQSLLDFRRVGCWYLKCCEGVKELRLALNKSENPKEAVELIRQFDWDRVKLTQDKDLPLSVS